MDHRPCIALNVARLLGFQTMCDSTGFSGWSGGLREPSAHKRVWTQQCPRAESLSRVRLFVTPWTVARQASLHGILQARVLGWVAISSSRGSSRPGIELESPASPPLAGRFFTTEPPETPLDSAGTPSVSALLPSPLTWTLKGSGLTAPGFGALTFSSKILRFQWNEPCSKAESQPYKCQLRGSARQAAGVSKVGDLPSISFLVSFVSAQRNAIFVERRAHKSSKCLRQCLCVPCPPVLSCPHFRDCTRHRPCVYPWVLCL